MEYRVVSAYPDRIEKNWSLWQALEWSPYWTSGLGIRYDFWLLAVHAMQSDWGHEKVILQDDIELTATPEPDGDISVYSGQSSPGHVCPRAFSCSPDGWRRAELRWRPSHQSAQLGEQGEWVVSGPTDVRLCEAWTPVDTVTSIAIHHDS